ncbi:MAG: hypothetical protein IKS22_00625 [Bacteroidales bacterium]|nr:hypothetical protein [Bacteroidales bacterium]
MKKNSPEIQELKKQVEESAGRKMKTTSDYISLAQIIWNRVHETLSPTTLKRLWGYVDGADVTRRSTLDVLSHFLGYEDWDDCLKHLKVGSGSEPVVAPHLSGDDLSSGDRIFVSWKPDRRCTFRYLGDSHFVVEKSENSKLKEGDTFTATLFILGEPLYLDNLVQGGNDPIAFVAGIKGGLCELNRL